MNVMKRFISILLPLFVSLVITAQNKELVILHTNDTHSCIVPLNPNLADTTKAGRGGFIRRAVLVEEQRKEHPNLLLLDSGDFSQGSPYYTLFKGDVEVGLMNLMHYDAATIGNHEFDFGVENMARIFSKATFPIVCANYDFKGTPLEGMIKPFVILNKGGIRIGVFGISPRLEGLVMAETCKGVVYKDRIEAANKVADRLRNKEKCDVVICLSHLGWDIDGIDDTEMTPLTTNIDLILGGHSHSFFKELQYLDDKNGRPVPNDQNGKSGLYVGKIVMKLK